MWKIGRGSWSWMEVWLGLRVSAGARIGEVFVVSVVLVVDVQEACGECLSLGLCCLWGLSFGFWNPSYPQYLSIFSTNS